MIPDELMPNKPKFKESARVKAHIDAAIERDKRFRKHVDISPHKGEYDRTSPRFQPKPWYTKTTAYGILRDVFHAEDYTQ